MTIALFAARLRELMKARGLTPFTLSLASQVRESTIRRWMSKYARSLPEYRNLKAVAQALDITVDQLLHPGDPGSNQSE